MRRFVGLLVLMVFVAGCSSPATYTITIHQDQGHEGAQPFTVTGAAVDEPAVCASGTVESLRLESMDGREITDADWAEMFDSAANSGGVAEMHVFQEYSCEDGSGSWVLDWDNRFDFATFAFEGRQDVGTWVVDSGAGSYEDLTGSGTITLDWDAGQAVLDGEIESG